MAQTINDNDRFEWPVKVSNSNPHANVDFHYGPYDSYAKMADTESGVPSTVYFPGFTAAVLNEDGTVTEYQLEVKEGRDYKGADGTVIVDNLQWVMKGVPKKDYITFKGTAASENALPTGAATGDMYIVSNGDDTYSEFVWTGERWELLGTATAEMKGALSVTGGGNMVIKGSSTSTSYNGSQNVELDLSGLAKKTDIPSLTEYAKKTDIGNACLGLKWPQKNGDGYDSTLFAANQMSPSTIEVDLRHLAKNSYVNSYVDNAISGLSSGLQGEIGQVKQALETQISNVEKKITYPADSSLLVQYPGEDEPRDVWSANSINDGTIDLSGFALQSSVEDSLENCVKLDGEALTVGKVTPFTTLGISISGAAAKTIPNSISVNTKESADIQIGGFVRTVNKNGVFIPKDTGAKYIYHLANPLIAVVTTSSITSTGLVELYNPLGLSLSILCTSTGTYNLYTGKKHMNCYVTGIAQATVGVPCWVFYDEMSSNTLSGGDSLCVYVYDKTCSNLKTPETMTLFLYSFYPFSESELKNGITHI